MPCLESWLVFLCGVNCLGTYHSILLLGKCFSFVASYLRIGIRWKSATSSFFSWESCARAPLICRNGSQAEWTATSGARLDQR